MAQPWRCSKCGHDNDPSSGDSVIRCAGCKKLRIGILPWIGGAGLIVLAVVIFFLLWGGDDPKTVFTDQVVSLLKAGNPDEPPLNTKQIEQLDNLAIRLKIGDQEKTALLMDGKKQFLSLKMKDILKKHPESNKLTNDDKRELCLLAAKLQIKTDIVSCQASRQEVETALVNGEFQKAQGLLNEYPDDPYSAETLARLNSPVEPVIEVQFKYDNQKESDIYSIKEPSLKTVTLNTKDNYRFYISPGGKGIYLYAFQIDSLGDAKWIFPDEKWSPGFNNPLQNGGFVIPGDSEWYYLDELNNTDSIKEDIYFIASPFKANDLEESYKRYLASTSENKSNALEYLKERIIFRRDAGLESVYWEKFSIKHD